MKMIEVLDKQTIDKIAAGEVIERPASIVKELVENAIDAGANAITVEIKDGGTSLVRITDNGEGIESSQVPLAFQRHATSKIRKVEDLLGVTSLGFRGEALSSISAVCQVELITKTRGSLTGLRYVIEGSEEKEKDEIGAPEGTTFLVRNLFFNTPARKKFLKSDMAEASHINDLMERLSLSHPGVSFKFINQNQTRLHTSGNGNLRDIIYNIYGRDTASQLLEVNQELDGIELKGFVGKPALSRGNRNYENFFVNGRYVKSSILSKAVEEAYKTFMMQHRYPFVVIQMTIPGEMLDINVHPTKMELRFSENEKVFRFLLETVRESLSQKELIPQVKVNEEKKEPLRQKIIESIPEPFEKKRIETLSLVKESSPYKVEPSPPKETVKPEQLNLFEEKLLSQSSVDRHRIIGQVFDTYWLVQFEEKLYIIDQHAAHEKVLYERLIKSLETREIMSQYISPPIVLTLSLQEEELLKKYMEHFQRIGFEIEHFGGKEYSIGAVPHNLLGIAQGDLFIELLDGLFEQSGRMNAEVINEKIASMACKAAVKGNHRMSEPEARELIGELLTLDNPYNCPHGRPTIISMTKYELEKKFKRIV